MEEQLGALEAACIEFQSTRSQDAEATMLQFSKLEHSLPLFQYTMERSKVPAAQYMAASAYKDAVAREWVNIPVEQRVVLCEYPLQILVQNYAQIQPFVRSALLTAAAIASKRGSQEPDFEKRSAALFDKIRGLLHSTTLDHRLIGFLLLSEIILQYNLATCASISLPKSFHVDAAVSFERRQLQPVFTLVLQSLFELNGLEHTSEWLIVISQALETASHVFGWDFVATNDKFLSGRAANIISDRIHATPSLGRVFISDDSIRVFFDSHSALRGNLHGAHAARECILSLVSITGQTFNKRNRYGFLERLVSLLVPLISDVSVVKASATGNESAINELVDIAAIIDRLVSNHGVVELIDTLQSLIEPLYQRTSGVGEAALVAAKTSAGHCDLLKESYELLISGCAALVYPVTVAAVPQAWHQPVLGLGARLFVYGVQLSLEDIALHAEEEEDGDDHDHMENIGTLSRSSPAQTIGHLSHIIQECGLELLGMWQHSSMGHGALLEQLLWLVRVSGYCLTDGLPGGGETPLVPDMLNKGDVEPVILLTHAIAHLCDSHSAQLEASRSALLSPSLTKSLLWFLRRWAGTYLLPDPALYPDTNLNPQLASAFGCDAVTVLVRMVSACFIHWNSEEEVVIESARLLLDLMVPAKVRSCVVSTDHFWKIVTAFGDSGSALSGLAPLPRRILSESVCRGCLAGQSDAERESLFNKVTEPINCRVVGLLANASHAIADMLHGPLMTEAVTVAEMLRGIARSTDYNNHDLVYTFSKKYFDTMLQILQFYHAEPTVVIEVLKFFRDLAERQSTLLPKHDADVLFSVAMQLMQAYAHLDIRDAGGVRGSVDAIELNKGRARQLCVIVQFLQHLITREFVDFASADGAAATTATKVAVDSLNFLLPLMSEELLRFPKLSNCFYNLLTTVSELYPTRIFALPRDTLSAFFHCLRVTGEAPQNSRNALDCLVALSTSLLEGSGNGMPWYDEACSHVLGFQRLLLEQLLMRGLDVLLLDPLAECLCILAVWRPIDFIAWTNALGESIADPALRVHLAGALQNVIPPNIPSGRPSRTVMKEMKQRVENFVTNVRGKFGVY